MEYKPINTVAQAVGWFARVVVVNISDGKVNPPAGTLSHLKIGTEGSCPDANDQQEQWLLLLAVFINMLPFFYVLTQYYSWKNGNNLRYNTLPSFPSGP